MIAINLSYQFWGHKLMLYVIHQVQLSRIMRYYVELQVLDISIVSERL